MDSITVAIKEDFIARQTRAEPIQALAELIWNGLDADAERVDVEFEFNDLGGGLSKVVVSDDGHGFPREDAKTLFGNLGGSWKRLSGRTQEKSRMVHGQEGKGRYKAFALGRAVDWKVTYKSDATLKQYAISMLENDLSHVQLSDESEVRNGQTGTTVVVDDIRKNFVSLSSQSGRDELAEIFALYLTHYRDLNIFVQGERVAPERAISARKTIPLSPIEDEEGKSRPAELEIIEWNRSASDKRTLYLCNRDGFPLSQVEARFHVGSFFFSAYLKSEYISELHNGDRLVLTEMEPRLQAATDEAKEKIKGYFRERSAERARTVVEQWKQEKVYPFEGEPASPIEQVERQVFDIVAASVQSYSSDLKDAPAQAKALHLRMLRHAMENSPTELQLILNEVLELPKRKQKELADLLQETSLSAIITAAKTIADRLKFITGLEMIIFDLEKKKKLKERSQLHKILAENTWLFGEEYNLWVSDRSLTAVLRKHKEQLDPDIVIDEPVKVVGKERGIVDLMLSTAVKRNRPDDFEHLVVELKAPKVKIGTKEITQIKEYAYAVDADERFANISGVRWHFWVVSNELTPSADQEIKGGPDARRRLVFRTDRISVGIRTWGEIIEENKARLQFFQEHLQYNATEGEAIKHLQERHRQFLEGVVVEAEEVSEESPEPEESLVP